MDTTKHTQQDTRKLRLKHRTMNVKGFALLDHDTFKVLARTTEEDEQFARDLVDRYNEAPALKEQVRVLREALEHVHKTPAVNIDWQMVANALRLTA